MIEICTVGGYNEVGGNCTAVKVDDEVVLFDMGLNMDKYIDYTEDREIINLSSFELTKVGAIPNISKIKDWKDKVIAIVPTHAHLDHIGALIFLGKKFNCPVIGTPFTCEVIKSIMKDEKIRLKNPLKPLKSKLKLSKNLTLEFVNITHSTPQTAIAVLHTKYGSIAYANDFKLDNNPTLGKKPDYKRLKQIGKNCKLLFINCLYSDKAAKTPSESVAREMLKDTLSMMSSDKAIILTTFASHLARIQSMIKLAKPLKRKIVILGRSMGKYIRAGENIKIINFTNQVDLISYSSQVKKKLKQIQKEGPEKYIIIATGHQGEPGSVLNRIAKNEMPLTLKSGDQIIFSCTVIPAPANIANRQQLESLLRQKGVRFFKDIHASGHGYREDKRELISMLKPKYIVPSHGTLKMASDLAELATEMGYSLGTSVFLMKDGQRMNLK